MVAREAHRLHDRLGPRHVERHLVEAGDLAQALHVVGDDGVVGAEHRAERPGALERAIEALLVEVVAEDVHAVGAGQVVGLVPVEVGHLHAGRRGDERAGRQVLAHEPAVLERHPIRGGELQVRDAGLHLARQLHRLGVTLPVDLGERQEAGPAPLGDFLRGVVGAEEARLVVLVERNQLGEEARYLRVAAQRRVLRLG